MRNYRNCRNFRIRNPVDPTVPDPVPTVAPPKEVAAAAAGVVAAAAVVVAADSKQPPLPPLE